MGRKAKGDGQSQAISFLINLKRWLMQYVVHFAFTFFI